MQFPPMLLTIRMSGFNILAIYLLTSMISWSVFVVYSIYEAASFPLYIRIIYLLLVRSEFARSPFYRLIAMNGILDVCHCAITIIFYRLPMFQPTMALFPREPSRLVTVPIVAYFSLIYQIFFLHSTISLNRVSAILWPLKQRAFWQRWWPAFPAAGATLSLLFTFHRIASVGQFGALTVDTDADCGYTPFPVAYDFYYVNQNMLTAILGSANLLVCLFLNLLTLCKILERRRTVQQQPQHLKNHQQQQQGFRHEVHLFIISVWMMLFMCIFISFELLLATGWLGSLLPQSSGNASGCFLLSQLPWVEALFSLSQPWVLLLANRSIRLAALPFLRQQQIQTAVMVVTVLPPATDKKGIKKADNYHNTDWN